MACAVGVATVSSAAASEHAGQPASGKVIARIRIPGNSGILAVGSGAVWVTSDTVATLLRIDPTRDVVVARTKIPTHNPCPLLPGGCGGAAMDRNALWISRTPDSSVLRIDPRDNSVAARIAVGPQPEGVATTPGAVWVVNRGGPTVSRIDPVTNRVVATIRIGPARACCSDHIAIAAGGGAVWASVPNLLSIARIDPATNAVKRIRLPEQPCAFLAADARAVWAAGGHCTRSIMRVNARTNRVNGGVKGVLVTPIGLALGFGSLWVADLDSKAIVRVNPRTARIVGRLRVGGSPVPLAIGFGSVWARDDTGRVLRIQP